MKLNRWLGAAGLLVGCAAVPPPLAEPPPPRPGPQGPTTAPISLSPSDEANNAVAQSIFAHFVEQHPDAGFADLKKELGLRRQPEGPLGFTPKEAKYYKEIKERLLLTRREQELFERHGVVSVDHQQAYTMASAYYAIYARDLPVLITTDSMLHALHRSFDYLLARLEEDVFSPVMQDALTQARAALKHQPDGGPALAQAKRDVDLYLTVALNLLQGAGDPGKPTLNEASSLAAPSVFSQDNEVADLLQRAAALKMELPLNECADCTEIFGGKRPIDWSQMQARGHYTATEKLRNYFRTMMWLGRADTGFTLTAPDSASGLSAALERERLGALLLVHSLNSSGKLGSIVGVGNVIDYLVGETDDLSLDGMKRGIEKLGIQAPQDIERPGLGEQLASLLPSLAPKPQIRSQSLLAKRGAASETQLHRSFHLFGQRFAVDSFVLSKVVFDSIKFKGKKVERMMPSGLDVMAALGNDEAVALLQPELEKYPYSTNLLASRKVVDAYDEQYWKSSVYTGWLQALRALDDLPENKTHFPKVMQTRQWQHKQLQTQLGSWAELRHDTILYTKQSYTAVLGCHYPDAYVEPYPAFYRLLNGLARRWHQRTSSLTMTGLGDQEQQNLDSAKTAASAFLNALIDTTSKLEALAEKELAGEKFTDEETKYLRGWINRTTIGSGGQQVYSGAYTTLFADHKPARFKPEVADVHTNPTDREVLEVAVGTANFLVMAVDEDCGHTAYVGPVYSYYEFVEPGAKRLTDEGWGLRLAQHPPPRPAWTKSFVAPASKRNLAAYNKKK